MYTVKLINEYLHGPIWIYDKDGFIRRKVAIISEDIVLQQLNEELRNIYDSFYIFRENIEQCIFDEEGYRENLSLIYDLVNKIKQRLEIINDGSFGVEDYITNEYNIN